ncbi:MAG: hypothetical protein IT161_24510 [Bryobacterales bacterium]|nr:hypothetical protein [Bryobacterales bacterium]
MNHSAALLCAVRGPIVLITLGSLLTVHKFGGMSFWVSWPILIIVLGVLKLLEMMAAKSASTGGNLP